MEKGQKDILRVFKPIFVKEVDQIDAVLDEMEARSVLAESTLESIREIKGRAEKARKIIEHLSKRPPAAFDGFYQSLITSENEALADKLKPECAPCRRVPRTKKRRQEVMEGNLAHPVQEEGQGDDEDNVDHHQPSKQYQPEGSLIEEDDLPQVWPDPNRSILDVRVKPVEADNMKKLYEYQNTPEFKGYKMTSNPRGRAVIINNETFPTLPPRTGNDADLYVLKEVLVALRFTVVQWNNFPLERLQMALRQEATHQDHWNSDAFIMIILSHGVRGAIKTHDEKNITIDDILEHFNRDKSPPLLYKPKMFFVQACQGVLKDSGDMADSAVGDVATGVEDMKIHVEEENSVTDAGDEKVPLFSDIIVVNATTPNFVSWRSENGTWFIQALAEVFARCSHREHLADLLRKVKNLVARGQTQVSKNVQVANISFDTLRNKVYFFPGLPVTQQASGPSAGNFLLDL